MNNTVNLKDLSVEELEGRVRFAFCYKYGDVNPGTFKNLAAFFTPKIPDQINCVKADDLFPGWND